MVVTLLNAGMALGSVTGGITLAAAEVGLLPWVSCAVFAGALLLVIGARRNAFPGTLKAQAPDVEQDRTYAQ